MNKSETALTIDHSYQVSSKSARRFVRRFFENLTYFSMAAILDLAMTSILTTRKLFVKQNATVSEIGYTVVELSHGNGKNVRKPIYL